MGRAEVAPLWGLGASPQGGRLAPARRPNRVRFLRTSRSPPAALHPVLRRRSCSRLQVTSTWRGLSPLRPSALSGAPPPASPHAPASRTGLTSRTSGRWGFAHNEQARRTRRPNRVQLPPSLGRLLTDGSFASCCSPPRLAATQLQADYGWALDRSGEDLHLSDQARSQAHSSPRKRESMDPRFRGGDTGSGFSSRSVGRRPMPHSG